MGRQISSQPLRHLARAVVKAALYLCLLGGLFIGLAPRAIACLCDRPLSGKHPCQIYWASEVISTGFLSSLTEVQDNYGRRLVARFIIEEAFRGVDATSIEIYTPAGIGSCGYPFAHGYRYFVYANRNTMNGRVGTDSCLGTSSLESAGPDLAYARAMKRGETNGVINLRTENHK